MRVDEAIIAIGRIKGIGIGFVTLPPNGFPSTLEEIRGNRLRDVS